MDCLNYGVERGLIMQGDAYSSSSTEIARERVCILGATGSIGLSTLDVIRRHPERFEAFALTAFNRDADMFQLCVEYNPAFAVMVDKDAAQRLEKSLADTSCRTKVLAGAESLSIVASESEVDTVMAAIVGAAGLSPNLSAARSGKKILLANKESLVLSGRLFMEEVEKSGSILLPIDSEHNAIFQCLPGGYRCGDALDKSIVRVLLTASGGPFRNFDLTELRQVTPEQAIAHPNWDMGPKISVDSASLMNKGLELIEACWLFDITPKQIDVHVHPESIVHSMVEYSDGSVLAQMGSPDMRTPIAYGLAWPQRIEAGVQSLNLFDIARLTFEQPDNERFPCLSLASQAFEQGGSACAVMNAANEVAVAAFLKGNVRFTDIPDIIADTLSMTEIVTVESIDHVLTIDCHARANAEQVINRRFQSQIA